MVAMVLKIIGALLVVVSAYFYGFHQGENKEELKNARTQISALERTIEEFKANQPGDAGALAARRRAASPARARAVTGAPGTPTGRLARGRSRSGMLLGRELDALRGSGSLSR